MEKAAKVYDYQARAREFQVNDWVVPFGASPLTIGRITQIWPGIAQADVEFSIGNKRYPIEDLKRVNKENSPIIPPETVSVPGGRSLTPVSAGPEAKETTNQGLSTYHPTLTESLAQKRASNIGEMSEKVAAAFMEKQGLYWHKADRNYRATKSEHATGKYCCPKKGCTASLKKAVYKRRGGKSDHLYVCPNCLFMVKDLNIHRDHIDPPAPVPVPVPEPAPMPMMEEYDMGGVNYIQELMANDKQAEDLEASWDKLAEDLSGDSDPVEFIATSVDYVSPNNPSGDPLSSVLAGLEHEIGPGALSGGK